MYYILLNLRTKAAQFSISNFIKTLVLPFIKFQSVIKSIPQNKEHSFLISTFAFSGIKTLNIKQKSDISYYNHVLILRKLL